MAATTASALQTAINTLNGHDVASPNPITILKEDHDAADYSRWYVTGHATKVSAPGEIMSERSMWVKTTISGDDAAQAAEVLAALESSDSSGTITTDANVDPDAQT